MRQAPAAPGGRTRRRVMPQVLLTCVAVLKIKISHHKRGGVYELPLRDKYSLSHGAIFYVFKYLHYKIPSLKKTSVRSKRW